MTTEMKKAETLRNFLFRPDFKLSVGYGTKESPCSLGAINLCLENEWKDSIPDGMSYVVGSYIRGMQDDMPEYMRNSEEWKEGLVLSINTGQDFEKERHDMLVDWFWDVVMVNVQPIADSVGYEKEWKKFLCNRSTFPDNPVGSPPKVPLDWNSTQTYNKQIKKIPSPDELQRINKIKDALIDVSCYAEKVQGCGINKYTMSMACSCYLGILSSMYSIRHILSLMGRPETDVYEESDPVFLLHKLCNLY